MGSLLAILGRLESALECYVGGLGLLLGAMFAVLGLMLAVLGCSWSLCWRSLRLGLGKVEEYDDLENVFISAAGARSAA